MKLRNSLYTLMIVLLSSCGRGTVYHSYQPVTSSGWERNDTLFFALPSRIPAGDYRVEIGLRHHEDYAYRDLWLVYGIDRMDTVQLTLAYESGNWHGNGAGGLYQFTETTPRTLHLTEERPDSLLRIVHIMRDHPLKGIRDVGIRLVKP